MEEISLKAQQLFSIGSWNITNGLLLALLVSLVIIIFSVIFLTGCQQSHLSGQLNPAVANSSRQAARARPARQEGNPRDPNSRRKSPEPKPNLKTTLSMRISKRKNKKVT